MAKRLMDARAKGKEAFPKTDIKSLVEMSLAVVAANFDKYPELDGVTDTNVL